LAERFKKSGPESEEALGGKLPGLSVAELRQVKKRGNLEDTYQDIVRMGLHRLREGSGGSGREGISNPSPF
jgi:hypothetical protein